MRPRGRASKRPFRLNGPRSSAPAACPAGHRGGGRARAAGGGARAERQRLRLRRPLAGRDTVRRGARGRRPSRPGRAAGDGAASDRRQDRAGLQARDAVRRGPDLVDADQGRRPFLRDVRGARARRRQDAPDERRLLSGEAEHADRDGHLYRAAAPTSRSASSTAALRPGSLGSSCATSTAAARTSRSREASSSP